MSLKLPKTVKNILRIFLYLESDIIRKIKTTHSAEDVDYF